VVWVLSCMDGEVVRQVRATGTLRQKMRDCCGNGRTLELTFQALLKSRIRLLRFDGDQGPVSVGRQGEVSRWDLFLCAEVGDFCKGESCVE
jgi:hypothetical protein